MCSMIEIIKQRIIDFHCDGLPDYIRRNVDVVHIKDMITTIVGGRKTGKTYLTYQIIDDLIKRKKISSLKQVCYLHFDDEALGSMTVNDLSMIDDVFLSLLNPKSRKKNIAFIFDEIHTIKVWEKFVLRLKKNRNYYVIVTGSSSRLEETNVTRQLRGKTFTNKLLPLSFKEFIKFNNYKFNFKRLSGSDKADIVNLFDKYIKTGSYPAMPLLEPRVRNELLQNYFKSIVASDFIFGKNIHQPLPCKIYLRNLLQKNACSYTHKKELNNLKSLGYSLAPKTIAEWFDYATENYFIGTTTINSSSIKRIEQNYRKIYCLDWTLANAISVFSESKISRALESIVYWQLIRSGYNVFYELVGPNNYEIDFVVSKPGQDPHLAIQVCVSFENEDLIEREIRGLKLIDKKYPQIEKLIITLYPTTKNVGIPVISAWQWLLK